MEDDIPAPRRRRRKATDMFEGDISEAVEAAEAHEEAKINAIAASMEAFDAAQEQPAVVAEEAAPEPESRDIGNWHYTPWRGLDMWTHIHSRTTTFKEEIAKRFRHHPSIDASDVAAYALKLRQRKRT